MRPQHVQQQQATASAKRQQGSNSKAAHANINHRPVIERQQNMSQAVRIAAVFCAKTGVGKIESKNGNVY